MSYQFHTIEEFRDLLDSRQASSVELTKDCLQRIRNTSELVNCFVAVHEERALAAAQRADQDMANGTTGPLTGIPIAHKDVFCVEGEATTCCSKMLASFVAPYNATIVERLSQAGAVCVGKTNMDEFAMGSSNETSSFGPVKNPWNLERVPGGSSGGSAAAVAAGLVPACTGSDTGGSIRQPASFCGVTGFKPSYGLNSRFGMVAFASSLDHPGTLTRTASEAEIMLKAMSGHDKNDSTSVASVPSQAEFQQPRVLGYPARLFSNLPSAISSCLDTAIRTLEESGYRIVEIDIPHFDVAVATYYVISCAEASTNLSRYDGIRYGHRSEHRGGVTEMFEHSRSEGFGTEVKRRILTGTFVLSVGYFDAYYLKAQKIRRLIRDDYRKAFESVDLILSPSTPTTAFGLEQMDRDPTEMYRQDEFTVPVSLSGLPSMSVPCGFAGELPVGMQLIGPHFGEASVIALGKAFQSITDWHTKRPILPS